MSTNRLSRSTPFWVLVGGSVVAIAGGAYLLTSKLTIMASTLTDGTATGADVYAGQIWAVLGAVVLGAGVIGLALALTLGALGSILAPAAVTIVESPVWEEEVVEVSAAPAYTPTTTVETAEPVEVAAPETRASSRAGATEASEPTIAFGDEPAPATDAPRER